MVSSIHMCVQLTLTIHQIVQSSILESSFEVGVTKKKLLLIKKTGEFVIKNINKTKKNGVRDTYTHKVALHLYRALALALRHVLLETFPGFIYIYIDIESVCVL